MSTFQKIKNDHTNKASSLGIADPQLPHKRKAPRRFEHGSAAPEYPSNPFEHSELFTLRLLILSLVALKVDLNSQGTKFTHNYKSSL